MAFRVFLSHSLDPTEQTLAWRLQTLAAAHGIEMYVPHHGSTYPSLAGTAPEAIQNAIDRCDCVLAIITAKAGTNVQRELKYALAKNKLVIPIVHPNFAASPLLAPFPHVFTFSPWHNPGKVESEIVEFLKSQQLSKEKQQALGALAAVGLGLLVLFALSEK